MLETIAVCMVLLLCCMGVVELYRVIIFRVFVPEKDKIFLVVVPVRGHDGTVEYTLRCAQSRVRWFRGRGRVICLDCGMDRETETLCRKMGKEIESLKIVKPEELGECLTTKLQSDGE